MLMPEATVHEHCRPVLGSTMSGLPGRSRRCSLKRYPIAGSADLTRNSGLVFLPLTRDMISLRFSGANMSFDFSPNLFALYPPRRSGYGYPYVSIAAYPYASEATPTAEPHRRHVRNAGRGRESTPKNPRTEPVIREREWFSRWEGCAGTPSPTGPATTTCPASRQGCALRWSRR